MTNPMVVSYLKSDEDFLRRYVKRTIQWICVDMPKERYDSIEVLAWYDRDEEVLIHGLRRHIEWWLQVKANKGIDPAEYLRDKDYREFADEILVDQESIAAKVEEAADRIGHNYEPPWLSNDDEDREMYGDRIPFVGPHISENAWNAPQDQ